MTVLVKKKIIPQFNKPVKFICLTLCALTVIFVPFLRGMIAEAFVWKESILVGWSNLFSTEPWHFYLTRLSELSPVYLFSFLSIILLFGKDRGDRLMLVSSFWILGAFIVLGNYQSRYILPAVPFLIILSARFQILLYDKLSLKRLGTEGSSDHEFLKTTLKVVSIGIGLFFIIQTLRTGWLLAIGPDFGYF